MLTRAKQCCTLLLGIGKHIEKNEEMKMKKVFAILLVLAVVAGFVFADAGTVDTSTKKLTVTSSVGIVYPQFKLTGVYSEDTYTAKNTTTPLDETPITALSIADNTIKIDCTIAQFGGKNKSDASAVNGYARYKGTVTFDITVGNLVEQTPGEGNDAKEVAGHIIDTDVVAAATYQGFNGTGSGSSATGNQNLTNAIKNTKVSDSQITAKYNGKVVDQNIGTFSAIWYQDDSVPTGEYKADITVEISAT